MTKANTEAITHPVVNSGIRNTSIHIRFQALFFKMDKTSKNRFGADLGDSDCRY